MSIRWYGLVLGAAILVGFAVARKYSWRFGIDKREIDDYAFWLTIFSFFGARLYFVLFEYGYFRQNPSEIYKFWHGGLSIYGALITGLVFSWVYSRKKAFGSGHLLDLTALSLPLSQAIGRFGNFFNQEAYGTTTNLPWKMYVSADGLYHHPTFLYEALWNVVVFFILKKLIGRRPGTLALGYLSLYALGRFFIELLRTDSVYVQGLKADAIVSAVVFLIAGILLVVRQRKS